MIFVTDKGRLCNNILQYGHLYAWGREHGRSTMSMRFAHMYPEFRLHHMPWHHPWVYVLVKLAAALHLIPTIDFNDINSDYAEEQRVMLSCKHVLAKGWCVRFPDLFEKYKSDILALFAFSDKVKQNVQRKFQAKGGSDICIGVHIRRGDYATWCGGHYFYDDAQYAAVIRQCVALFPGKNVRIFICGNDPHMDKNYFKGQFGKDCVSFPGGSPAEDLCLFSLCDYLIGPPSTFTLVASMYHDAALYWIVDPQKTLNLSSFGDFSQLFLTFDDLYIES